MYASSVKEELQESGTQQSNSTLFTKKIKAEEAAQAARYERLSKISNDDYKVEMFNEIKEKHPNAQQTESGLVFIIENPGEATKPVRGTDLTVHYRGTFRADGTQFDASYDRGQPMTFKYLQQRMIPGFEEGLGMLGKGGKAKLIIPFYAAYGPKGRPGAIPPFSDLIFDIEIVDLKAGTDGHEGHNHDGHNHDGHDHQH